MVLRQVGEKVVAVFREKPPYRNGMEAFCVYRYNISLLLRLYPLPDTRLLSVQYPPQFILFYLNSPLKVILLFTL